MRNGGIENEEWEAEFVTENKESENDNVEENEELEAGLDFPKENNVDEVNNKENENLEAEDSSGDPEHDADRCTLNTATRLVITITPDADGTYSPPENLLGITNK